MKNKIIRIQFILIHNSIRIKNRVKMVILLTGLFAATPPSIRSKERVFPSLSLVVKKCAGRNVGAAEVATQISASRAFLKAFSFAYT